MASAPASIIVRIRPVPPLLGVQRLLVTALVSDGILVVAGVGLAPSVTGVARVVADLGLFILIGGAAVYGPVRLSRFADMGDVCVWSGAAFAFVYALDLLLGFAAGSSLGVSEYWFFVAAALVASVWAVSRSGRLLRGIAAACWALVLGTAMWSAAVLSTSYSFWQTARGYAFWSRDGAADFRGSGVTDFWPSVLDDLQGAMFFHPLLSVVVGAICGTMGGSAVVAVRKLRGGLLRRHS